MGKEMGRWCGGGGGDGVVWSVGSLCYGLLFLLLVCQKWGDVVEFEDLSFGRIVGCVIGKNIWVFVIFVLFDWKKVCC